MGDQDGFSSDDWSVADVHTPMPASAVSLRCGLYSAHLHRGSQEPCSYRLAGSFLTNILKHDCLLCLVKTFSKMSFSPLNTGGLNNPTASWGLQHSTW